MGVSSMIYVKQLFRRDSSDAFKHYMWPIFCTDNDTMLKCIGMEIYPMVFYCDMIVASLCYSFYVVQVYVLALDCGNE